MSNTIYYIDPTFGNDEYDGLTECTPKRDYKALPLSGGDTVLFKRGSVIRSQLEVTSGTEGAPVTYSAYGEGAMPTFLGSIDVSSPECWEPTERKNVWRLALGIPTDVGNFVFNSDECTATLRWSQEELVGQGDFFDTRFGECNENKEVTYSPEEVLLYSDGHPCEVYSHIEVVPYAKRTLCAIKSFVTLDTLCFKNSGVHAITGVGEDMRGITIRGCDILNIGGCVWSRERKIRFGNGIEFWIGAEDILIEGNRFINVYDSCATHQGPDRRTPPARNFHVRGNLFDTFSMAAFEYRAQMMIASSFTNNVCRNAGCGFGMLGEELPRLSEIWPQPMGHHIFLWRVWEAPEGGSLLIADNIFENAPNGAAVYSIICPEAEAQVTFRGNICLGDFLIDNAFLGGKVTKLTQ